MCVIILADLYVLFILFFKQKTAYELRISDWSSDVCSSDLFERVADHRQPVLARDMVDRTVGIARQPMPRFGAETFFGPVARLLDFRGRVHREIGRASCRERVCPYV